MQFEKVSYKIWKEFWDNVAPNNYTDEEIQAMYDCIKLPAAGSQFAAGHDFYSPVHIDCIPEHVSVVPTGIRWITEDQEKNTFLLLCPRSGLGVKYGVRLRNTVGIVDADYYCSDNEGHIMAAITTDRSCEIHAGDRFMQGIVIPYLRCGQDSNTVRNGGFGSTGE